MKNLNLEKTKCIALAKQRLSESFENQLKKNSFREFFVRPLRLILLPIQIPVSLPKNLQYYLISDPDPNSKNGAVYNELIECGVQIHEIWFPGKCKKHISDLAKRVIFRLPISLFYILRALYPKSGFDLCSAYILIALYSYRKLLKKYRNLCPIILSDVSPMLQVLWSAAATEGNRAIWWQDDYHHQGPILTKICAAFVLNNKGYNAVKKSSANILLFQRKTRNIKPIKKVPFKPSVGVATNAFFEGTNIQIEELKMIKEKFGCGNLNIRLHPNSNLSNKILDIDWIKIAPKDEELTNFASRVDFVIVGNSAVQLIFLAEGIPVVHYPRFDQFHYDLYGYCESNLVYGALKLDDISVAYINEHYKNVFDFRLLRTLIGPSTYPNVNPAYEFLRFNFHNQYPEQ